jgi:hypothetical protein
MRALRYVTGYVTHYSPYTFIKSTNTAEMALSIGKYIGIAVPNVSHVGRSRGADLESETARDALQSRHLPLLAQ